MATRKTHAERRADLLAEKEKLSQQIAALDAKTAQQIGKIAVQAGLADLNIDDEQLKKEFEAMAARFRGGKAKPSSQASSQPAES